MVGDGGSNSILVHLHMEQVTSRPITLYSKEKDTESRGQLGFWLSILVLCLLPLEWLMLPFGLKVADLALVLVTLYGLAKAWLTNQRLVFPLLLPMWLILLSSL